MALRRRLIKVQFVLANGSFGNSPIARQQEGLNTLSLNTADKPGLRISAKVLNPGGETAPTLEAAIYGMTLSQMNQLSTLGVKIQLLPTNEITVLAGDAVDGMSMVFKGTVTGAFADMSSAPDVAFRVTAQTAVDGQVDQAPPVSFNGSVGIATILKPLAEQMGLKFENNGVNKVLSNPYLSSSTFDQIARVCLAADVDWTIEKGVLAIWPRNRSRESGGQIPLISRKSIEVGYPTYTAEGIIVKALYTPGIDFGKRIKVESDLIGASNEWTTNKIELDLDSNVNHGKWFMTLNCIDPNFPETVPSGG